MAGQSNRNPRVHLNKLLRRLSSHSTGRWSTEPVQWAVPGPSIEFSSTTRPWTTTRLPVSTPTSLTTLPDAIQADEPIELDTTTLTSVRSSNPCADITNQLSGMRMAVGISVGLTLVIALGLVYVVWLYHQQQHHPSDEEAGLVFNTLSVNSITTFQLCNMFFRVLCFPYSLMIYIYILPYDQIPFIIFISHT